MNLDWSTENIFVEFGRFSSASMFGGILAQTRMDIFTFVDIIINHSGIIKSYAYSDVSRPFQGRESETQPKKRLKVSEKWWQETNGDRSACNLASYSSFFVSSVWESALWLTPYMNAATAAMTKSQRTVKLTPDSSSWSRQIEQTNSAPKRLTNAWFETIAYTCSCIQTLSEAIQYLLTRSSARWQLRKSWGFKRRTGNVEVPGNEIIGFYHLAKSTIV